MVSQLSVSKYAVTPAPHVSGHFREFSSRRMSPQGRTDFIYQLMSEFPEIAARIDESDFGILPLEIGVMTLATKEAINRFGLHTVSMHFAFMGKLFDCANKELKDAIQIAYVENLLLGETSPAYAAARFLLPRYLGIALKQSESHFKLINSFRASLT